VIEGPGPDRPRPGHGRAGAPWRYLPESGTSGCALRLLSGALRPPWPRPVPPLPPQPFGSRAPAARDEVVDPGLLPVRFFGPAWAHRVEL